MDIKVNRQPRTMRANSCLWGTTIMFDDTLYVVTREPSNLGTIALRNLDGGTLHYVSGDQRVEPVRIINIEVDSIA